MSSLDSISCSGAYDPSNFSDYSDQGLLYYLNSIPNSCKEWPALNEGAFKTDDFRMYHFKVYPCRRTYKHVWSQCPFYHSGENARRRNPRLYPYSPLQCASFRATGTCCKGDECEFAHGLFETWLHPAQYRTKICRDRDRCARVICFFAHDHLELRPIYTRTGCAQREFPTQLPAQIRPQPVKLSTMSNDQINLLSNLRMLQNLRLKHSDSVLGLDHSIPRTVRSGATSFFSHIPSSELYATSDSDCNIGSLSDYYDRF